MARCSRDECQRWRPDVFVRTGRAGCQLDGEWYCSPTCLERATTERLSETTGGQTWPVTGPRVGALLVHQRALTVVSLKAALRAQVATRLPLGRQLEEMGLVSQTQVLRALSAQAGVSYLATVDPSQVRLVSEPLSSATLCELGLVVVGVDATDERLKVACVAPVPWPALRAIYEVTGWATEPLLVSDRDWKILTDAQAEQVEPNAIRVNTFEDAAALTAQVARETHAREMSLARVDPYILVCIESRNHHEELLLHMSTLSKEGECLAVST